MINKSLNKPETRKKKFVSWLNTEPGVMMVIAMVVLGCLLERASLLLFSSTVVVVVVIVVIIIAFQLDDTSWIHGSGVRLFAGR